MSVETQKENAFGAKKVTQAEVAMFVQQALRPMYHRQAVVQNAVETLLMFLAEVGIDGRKVTSEELAAFVKSKNNPTAQVPPSNGTEA